jgi:hypothetical protein
VSLDYSSILKHYTIGGRWGQAFFGGGDDFAGLCKIFLDFLASMGYKGVPLKGEDGMNIFIALDRSGSMGGPRWTDSIGALNEYINGLKSQKIEGTATIVAFDSVENKTRLEKIELSIPYFEGLAESWVHPAGMTPLYDAAAHVMDLALASKADRNVVVILTDGMENTSKEHTQESIKAKTQLMQSKGYEVIFLGANFDVTQYTQQAGLSSGKMRSFDMSNLQARSATIRDLTTATAMYSVTGKGIEL